MPSSRFLFDVSNERTDVWGFDGRGANKVSERSLSKEALFHVIYQGPIGKNADVHFAISRERLFGLMEAS